jgi:hypothetical protein
MMVFNLLVIRHIDEKIYFSHYVLNELPRKVKIDLTEVLNILHLITSTAQYLVNYHNKS